MNRRASSGFTLLELVIALAIASILLGIAVPSFISVVRDAKLGTVVDPARRALMIARSEAARSRTEVTVCPRATGDVCGTDWNQGLIVFIDNVTVAGEPNAVRDNGDDLVSVIEPHGTDNTLKVIASTDRTAGSLYTPNYIRYGIDGRASWQNGSLIACDARGEEHSRSLNVTLTGSVEEGRRDGDADVVMDVFNNEIECP